MKLKLVKHLNRPMTKTEVAQAQRVSLRTIDNWMARGWVPYIKIGGSVRFVRADVEAAMNRFRVPVAFEGDVAGKIGSS